MTPNVPFSRPGAVDLSQLAKARPPQAAARPGQPGQPGQPGKPGQPRQPGQPNAVAGSGAYAIDVTEESFQRDVVERSMEVPVLVDFWADWCQPCKQLSPLLERLSDEYAGQFVLARIDIEAEQRLAQAAQVQSIPFVLAVIGGQALPLFQGALGEAQLRQAIEQVLQAAAQNGINGVAPPLNAAAVQTDADATPPRDPRYAAAEVAMENGDLKGAIDAYEKVLDQYPADPGATEGLARARLLDRVGLMDQDEARKTAAQRPNDVATQCAVADLDVVTGNADDGFGRLLGLIGRTSGPEREAVRLHLLDLFNALGPQDPRVHAARGRLGAVLF